MRFATILVAFLPVISALTINPHLKSLATRESVDEACAKEKTYVIQSGDTLTKIGEKFDRTVPALVYANRDTITNPDIIFAGANLNIPKKACNKVAPPLAPTKPAATATCAPKGTETPYTVVAGDTLTKIAEKFNITLGSVVNANKDNIPNPDLIFPGDKVKIPICS
ncbi:hypothetical protein HYFRA_00004668 [Hymenoscyphus fraxineus]|uniref:LysM domain-containing protein n=1 Tax=Hymenoscyphus fraxineus TaxID=746836 RepID=A0A9N9PTP6_9HELO|nr:hypothetical protein HYFRA_00004668 [Hymenoscyphus fraxineus]